MCNGGTDNAFGAGSPSTASLLHPDYVNYVSLAYGVLAGLARPLLS
jgi:hypothetical protein